MNKNSQINIHTQNKLSGLYAICDIHYSSHSSHLQLAQELLAGGISIIQLRMKGEQDLQKVESSALEILQLKKQYSFIFILNDFVELAAKLGVDGIHLGQDDMEIHEARQIVGANKLIGYSSHSLEEAVTAEKKGADYVALGAIYPTQTKGPGHPVVGISTLNEVVRTLSVPVVAIGGIDQNNLTEVLATQVNAVAMITALTQAEKTTAAAQEMLALYSRVCSS